MKYMDELYLHDMNIQGPYENYYKVPRSRSRFDLCNIPWHMVELHTVH